MNYTTNFNLNKPEGTDLYNHLTVDNPNMDTIDAAMQANKLASVGAATELVSGTVHAITRADSNQNIFKFKATGDFKAGDTITVDGVSVSAFTTSGQQLLDDAYVLSAEVLCILDSTSLWVLVNKIPEASEIKYDANNTVYDQFTNVNNKIDNKLTIARLNYDANLGYFPIALTTNVPAAFQLCVPCRITRDGSVFILFYDSNNRCFRVAATIVNNSPLQDGDLTYVNYIS